MERLGNTKPSGLTANALRTWGIFFLAAGILARGILQNQFLGLGTVSSQQLLEAMQSSEEAMIIATLSLVLQAMETCAVPIFSLLLVEGFQHTKDYMRYLARVCGVAVLSEIPYNMAMSGKIFDFSSRNPAFGIVLGLLVLYFYQRYAEKKAVNFLIKLVVTVAALIWTKMLEIEFGAGVVLVVWSLWTFRKNPLYRNFIGATVVIVCTLFSPFYLAAPMGFLAVHFYNGEKGAESRAMNYLAYPALLLAVGLVAMFVF